MQLLCLGDVALSYHPSDQPSWAVPGNLVPSTDVQVMFNWEFPMGQIPNSKPRDSGKRFIADPDAIKMIQHWAPGIATMATNHILDAGEEGLAGTIRSLQNSGFRTVGAGMTSEEMMCPLSWETAEGKLAIVNWVFPETHPDWMAIPGSNCWPGSTEARRIVQELRRRSDWVLVVLHWSDELFPFPRSADREIARELADMGVDIIIGHHPHVVRGSEVIGACPVFYSLGNFYFAEIKSRTGAWISREAPRNREGLGVKISFRRGRAPQVQLLSFWNTGGEVALDPKQRAKKRLEWASLPLQKLENQAYVGWYKIQRARFDHWDMRWHFGLRRRGVGETLRKMLMKFRRLPVASN